jgi:hypothetical protein
MKSRPSLLNVRLSPCTPYQQLELAITVYGAAQYLESLLP